MIPNTKKIKLIADLRNYKKKYINEKYIDLDESATRLMINEFLTEILGFKALDEVKTEYMIKGTYADYVVKIGGKRYFLVEVKAKSIELSDKHLRQAVNYAANEGIEWALLTNGKNFQLYKIIFDQPIYSKLVFNIDLDDIKLSTEALQYITKTSVQKNGLDFLWNKVSALDPQNIASFLYSKKIVTILKKELKYKYRVSFDEADIMNSIRRVIEECITDVRPIKEKKTIKPKSEPTQEIQAETT